MIFTHNLTPHGSTLWINITITINRRMLFNKNWYDKKIIFVTDLLDDCGQFLQFSTFMVKFDMQCFYREHSWICKAVPLPLVNIIQNTLSLNYPDNLAKKLAKCLSVMGSVIKKLSERLSSVNFSMTIQKA